MIRSPWKIRRPCAGRGPRTRTRRGPSHWGPSLRWGDEGEAESGFTLVELMVVIVIIGLLATVVIINVLPATDKAAMTKAKADVATLEQGVEMYRLNKLRYPSVAEGLQAVSHEGYVKRLPKDPWGNPYRYAAPARNGAEFEIYSYGADGREGGTGKDADIGNWDS
jgi:general secretion pathway protein G